MKYEYKVKSKDGNKFTNQVVILLRMLYTSCHNK